MSKLPPMTNKMVGFTFPEKAITKEINKIITLKPLQPSMIRAINLWL